MANVIVDRLACLSSIVSGKKEVRHVGLAEGIASVLKWYGAHRFLMGRRLKVTPIDKELDWIELGPYGIAWPRNHPLSRFVGALIELQAPSNAHFYFDKLTEVREGAVVVDIGASEGTFAVECLVKHGAAQVWCFEPESSMGRALRTTIERNRLAGRLHWVDAAAAETTRTIQILENPADPMAAYCVDHTSGTGQPGLSGVLREVQGIALDHWASQIGIERLDYLKIDAEGSDLAVLRGAKKCLQRWRPAIAVTTYHDPDHCNEMIQFLSSLDLGYRFRVRGVIVFDAVARPVMLHAACHTEEANPALV